MGRETWEIVPKFSDRQGNENLAIIPIFSSGSPRNVDRKPKRGGATFSRQNLPHEMQS